jgi:hypothetical protein
MLWVMFWNAILQTCYAVLNYCHICLNLHNKNYGNGIGKVLPWLLLFTSVEEQMLWIWSKYFIKINKEWNILNICDTDIVSFPWGVSIIWIRTFQRLTLPLSSCGRKSFVCPLQLIPVSRSSESKSCPSDWGKLFLRDPTECFPFLTW